MRKRRQEWTPPPLCTSHEALFKYIQNVVTASEGCVTDKIYSVADVQAATKTPAGV